MPGHTVCPRVRIHYTNTYKCTHQSTNRSCRGTHKSAHPGHLQSRVYTPSSVCPHRSAEEFTCTVPPAAPVLAKCRGRDRAEEGNKYPKVGHPVCCYFSAGPTGFQVALQLLDIGCWGVLDLKPLLQRWSGVYWVPARATPGQMASPCPKASFSALI